MQGLQLEKVNGQQVDLAFKESDALLKYVTLKAYKFPYINVLWAGTIIMVLGFFVSMWHRRHKNRLRVLPPRAEKRPEPVEI